MKIRLAISGDVPFMLRLERQCSRAAHWPEKQYQQLFPPGAGGAERLVLVAEGWSPGGESDSFFGVFGFLVARHLAPEWELENIVVAPVGRRSGLGQRLLDALLTRARETNSDSVFLEVRESNAAARALYEKAGFELSGRRKGYYANPREDAALYRRKLP